MQRGCFDGMFLLQAAKGIRLPFADGKTLRSPPPTWGLPPLLCWPTQSRISARSTN
ncbi:hypothetical protein AB4156_15290 [Cupriavidus sp. 2MCAB6]|uniref:hypothetical protein n=1 Tax=Cupriavidus sp. 2MCAB6 TaxID=3232981 RepID=UPI003F9395AA